VEVGSIRGWGGKLTRVTKQREPNSTKRRGSQAKRLETGKEGAFTGYILLGGARPKRGGGYPGIVGQFLWRGKVKKKEGGRRDTKGQVGLAIFQKKAWVRSKLFNAKEEGWERRVTLGGHWKRQLLFRKLTDGERKH